MSDLHYRLLKIFRHLGSKEFLLSTNKRQSYRLRCHSIFSFMKVENIDKPHFQDGCRGILVLLHTTSYILARWLHIKTKIIFCIEKECVRRFHSHLNFMMTVFVIPIVSNDGTDSISD